VFYPRQKKGGAGAGPHDEESKQPKGTATNQGLSQTSSAAGANSPHLNSANATAAGI